MSVNEAGPSIHPKQWVPPDAVFGRTYRVLRWTMPVLLLWLILAIAWEWINSGILLPMTSISAYYYTDAETVFVGVLIGLGVLLIVLEGRTPWEDALMNTAGSLAPFVALLPTPVDKDDKCIASYCTAVVLKDEIPNNHEIIAFNVLAAIPIWLTLCIYLGMRARAFNRGNGHERYSSIFSAAVTFLCGLVALTFWVIDDEHRVFYKSAHLAAAGLMIFMLILSIAVFAKWIGASNHPYFRNARPLLNNAFWLLLWLTLVLIVCCIAIAVLKRPWDHKVLVLEVAALAPFAFYWVMQGHALARLDRTDRKDREAAKSTAPPRDPKSDGDQRLAPQHSD